MTLNPKSTHWLLAAAFCMGIAGAGSLVQAQTTNYLVDQFDTDTTSLLGNNGWGTAVPYISWDNSQNATTTMGPNTPGSGSAQWVISWPTTSDQVMVTHSFNNGDVLDLNAYTNISFDIKFDPSSATDGAGNYGAVEVDWVPQSDGWPSTPNTQAYQSFAVGNNGWQHVSLALNASANTKLSAVRGLGFKIQQNKTGSNLSGTTTFWMDNIILGALSQTIRPTVSVAPVTTPPGLTMVAPGGGNEYNRTLLMALDPVNIARNFSWVGSGDTPVTYSMTIAAYPDTNHTAFQAVIFLVPNGAGGDPSIDYTAPNVAQLVVMNNADGSATGAFQYKTNQPSGNSMFSGSGTLGTVRSASPLGTWSLTFLNDTNITLTGPGNVTTNFNLPDDITAQLFGNPLTVYFGNQQNGGWNAGQSSTYSEFKVQGITASPEFDEVFTTQTSIDTTKWTVDAYAPNNTFIVQPTDKYWLSWTVPDTGFGAQVSSNLAPGSWVDPGLTNLVTTTLGKKSLLPGMATNFPTAPTLFFRMKK
jgi:hypothetical protein